MTSRRKFVFSTAIFVAGSVSGYLINDLHLSEVFTTQDEDAIRPPPSGIVGIEFENGEIEKIGNLLVSRSEFEWMTRHHPEVSDPFDIVKLLASN